MDSKTSEFKVRLEEQISTLERETSVEFVPVFLESSSDYTGTRCFTAALAAVAALAALRGFELNLNQWLESLVLFAVGLPFFFLIHRVPGFARCIPGPFKRKAVETAAREIFIEEEVFATRERSGVLILVSLFEHAVYVLADKGVQAKAAPEAWAQLGTLLADDFDHKQPGASFFQALSALTEKLKGDFPPSPENPNELSDHLRRPKR
jgi:putative membrane protein